MGYPGLCCPVNLLQMHSTDVEPIPLTPMVVDDDGFERGQRINGYDECPRCRLWWPVVEEPDMWEESETLIQVRDGCFEPWRTVTHARLQIERYGTAFAWGNATERNPYKETRELWAATGWWGAAVCECGLLLVTQPDGTPEAYDLTT